MTPSGLILLTLTLLLILDVLPHAQNKLNCERFNILQPQQVRYCDLISLPVCGTDGTTYENRCQLCINIRKSKGRLGLRHKGNCHTLPRKLKKAGH